MIRKIVLENFMSHKRTVIEPAEGLTVLTGPNNCGKSAVVVALQALCYNDGHKSFIRHGEKEARVLVETSEGHKIEWIRGKDVSYKIDGREIHRLNRSTPEDLQAKLRLPRVDVPSGDPVNVHFSEQKDPIFLVNDKSGARAARFFSAASDAALLLKMQTLHRDRVRDAGRDERRLLQEIDEAKRELERYEGIASLEERCTESQRQFDRLATDLQAAEHLYRLREAIHERVALAGREAALAKSLAKLPPQIDAVDTRDLAQAIEGIGLRTTDAMKVAEKLDVASRSAPSPLLEDTRELGRTLDMLAGQAAAIGKGEELVKVIDEQIAVLSKEIERYVADNPTCPVCGGPMTAEKVLGAAHA